MMQLESRIDAGHRSLPLPAPVHDAAPGLDRTAEIGDLWRILWRRRASVLWTALILVAAALVAAGAGTAFIRRSRLAKA